MKQSNSLLNELLKNFGAAGQGGPSGPSGPSGKNGPYKGGVPSLPLGRIGLIAGALVLLWGSVSSYFTVQPEERAVIKRFGAVIKTADPGLHFKIPFGVDSVQLVKTERVLKQEFGFRTQNVDAEPTTYSDVDHPDESLMLTGDLNIIDVEWVVQYRISDPMKFLYHQRDPEGTLRDISESVMRRAVGNRLGSDVLTTARVEISNIVRDEIQTAMERYDNGIRVVTVELQDVVPPVAVQPAFNEVNESRQERERMINEATKQANQEIPRAKGEANRLLAEAEGYATERVNYAKGETARFRSILAEYEVAPAVTRTRMYLETLNAVLPKVGAVYVVKEGQTGPIPLLNMRDPRSTQEAK